MAKNKRRKRTDEPFWVHVLRIFSDIISNLAERLGAPFAIFVVLIFGFYYFGTPEQKKEFFDMYFLGKHIENVYPHLFISLLFVIIILSQRSVYQKKIQQLESEKERLAQWKSKHQEDKIGKQLHHTRKSKNKGE